MTLRERFLAKWGGRVLIAARADGHTAEGDEANVLRELVDELDELVGSERRQERRAARRRRPAKESRPAAAVPNR